MGIYGVKILPFNINYYIRHLFLNFLMNLTLEATYFKRWQKWQKSELTFRRFHKHFLFITSPEGLWATVNQSLAACPLKSDATLRRPDETIPTQWGNQIWGILFIIFLTWFHDYNQLTEMLSCDQHRCVSCSKSQWPTIGPWRCYHDVRFNQKHNVYFSNNIDYMYDIGTHNNLVELLWWFFSRFFMFFFIISTINMFFKRCLSSWPLYIEILYGVFTTE